VQSQELYLAHLSRFRRSREEKVTYRRGAWTVLTLYFSLFVLGGIAIFGNHSISNPGAPRSTGLFAHGVSNNFAN
jgi:hypothetical protein